MSQTPTLKDEAWRYADAKVLAALSPDTFDAWKDVEIAAGETRLHTMTVGSDAPELHRIRIKVGAGGRAELFVVNAGDDYTRVEVVVHLSEGAHFEFGGVTIGGGDATREFVTRIDHSHPDASSHQVVRGVHWGQATGNFLGRIDVGRGGQRTDAAQDYKGLLLEKGATLNAKPELEIYADDVKCAHGAAIGQMDEAARYYMASRGIGPDLAKKLLVRAFIADAFTALADEDKQAELLEAALAELGEAL